MIKRILLTFLVFFCMYFSVYAEGGLKIGTIERPPFAYQENGEWKGFSIDLWKRIANKNSLTYDFVEYQEFSQLLEATKSAEVDMSVANISITLEREQVMDFSQPIFDSGLNVLGIKGIPEQALFLPSFIDNILKGLMYICILLVVVTHFFRVLNILRGNIGVFSYFLEIIPIFFEVLRQIKEGYGLKILMISIMGGSIFLVSFYSQKIAYAFSSYDANYIENNISEYNNIKFEELGNLRVGVTEGSTSMIYLNRKGIETVGFALFDEMLLNLRQGNIDVIVHDDPILKYFAENEGKEKFIVVGKTFHPEKFGILYPENSSFRESIDRNILEIREAGEYKKIYEKYFGK